MDTVTYQGLEFVPYLTRDQIAQQVQRVADEIRRDCPSENPLFLCVLNGAFMFAADLFRACQLAHAEITFIRFKSYEGTSSTGKVREIMGLSEDIEGRDVIIIEDRLTELRYKIESLQSSLNNWDRRVSYSTVYLSIKEVREYTPEETVEPTYGEELIEALKGGLHNAGQFLKDLLVFLVEVIPVLVILVPLVWLAVWLIRKLNRNGAAKRAARQEARLEKKARAAKEKADKAKGKANEAAAAADDGEKPEEKA